MRDFLRQLAVYATLAAYLASGSVARASAGAGARVANDAASAGAGTSAAAGSQAGTLANTVTVNGQGSDNSLKSSSVYIMQALMDLNNTHLAAAVKNGYNAYGQYRNAENLDHVRDQSAAAANSLGSMGSAPLFSNAPTNTTFRRLDPTFLRQGEADAVAAEFERETGMKREEFLNQLSSISEQKIRRTDPQMIDKALSRFEGFLQAIPNQEFRQNAERNMAYVPDSLRRGMVAQAVAKLSGLFADAGGGASVLAGNLPELPKEALAAADAKSAATPANGATRPRGPASTEAGAPLAQGVAGKSMAEAAVSAALFAQKQDGTAEATIFQQISKRYRILTPTIWPR